MTNESRHNKLTDLAVEQFKNHVIRKSGEDRWTLMQPYKDGKGFSSNLWVEIVILEHGGLLVDGDIDPILFRYFSGPPQKPNDRDYQLAILSWMGKSRGVDSYMIEKATIGAGGKGTHPGCTFSSKEAVLECQERLYQYVEVTFLDDFLYGVDIEVQIYDNAIRRAFVSGSLTEDWKTPDNLKKSLTTSYGDETGVCEGQFDTMGGVCSFFGVSIPEALAHIKNYVKDDEVCQVWKEAPRYAEGSTITDATLFNHRLYEDLEEAGLQDVFEYVGEIGIVPSAHTYYAWAAIRRLLEILEAEETC